MRRPGGPRCHAFSLRLRSEQVELVLADSLRAQLTAPITPGCLAAGEFDTANEPLIVLGPKARATRRRTPPTLPMACSSWPLVAGRKNNREAEERPVVEPPWGTHDR